MDKYLLLKSLHIAGTGLGNAALHNMDYLHIRWLSWGYGLFVLSGVIGVMVLIPIQIAPGRAWRAPSPTGARYPGATGPSIGAGTCSA